MGLKIALITLALGALGVVTFNFFGRNKFNELKKPSPQIDTPSIKN